MKEYQEIFSYELDASDKRMVEHNLTYKSKEALIQEYLKEITLFTNPYLQTIHFRYRWIISCLVYLGCPVTPIIDIHKSYSAYAIELKDSELAKASRYLSRQVAMGWLEISKKDTENRGLRFNLEQAHTRSPDVLGIKESIKSTARAVYRRITR